LKASFFSRKSLRLFETESLAEVQFVIDSCRFVSQSNCLNNSNKDCDWLILACFIREQCTADATFAHLENKVWFENSTECVGKLSDSLFVKYGMIYWLQYLFFCCMIFSVLCKIKWLLLLLLLFIYRLEHWTGHEFFLVFSFLENMNWGVQEGLSHTMFIYGQV